MAFAEVVNGFDIRGHQGRRLHAGEGGDIEFSGAFRTSVGLFTTRVLGWMASRKWVEVM